MQIDARTDGADLAALIAHVAPQLGALAATAPEAYAALRQALGLLPATALSEEVALALRTHLEDHCRHCGAMLSQEVWPTHRIPWCDACRGAGVAQRAPLWSPEDWPNAPERAWCAGLMEEAERLRAAGDAWGAWRALEAAYLRAEARGAWRERAALESPLALLAAARGDWHYAVKLYSRQRAWYRVLGDTARLTEAEGRIREAEGHIAEQEARDAALASRAG